ncbi:MULTISPECIES: hypothetical protein [unclassified Streptomyces]|uniref:hypothetical protein n=1 Tax=unclassified Streptomyces TaxID=2593676 RepID=UPI002E14469A|nr:hypothetical protein OG457_39720 [Streptomyces sp. NBC_01207]WTA22523.1 hypothetical protein OG365_33365 [Streptomyces sp. NBC_00853]
MTHHIRPRPRPRRLALLVASTAIAAGGVLVPTTAFAATSTAPHGVVADGTDGGVHVPDGRQQWQCFAAPCEPPGHTGPETDPHDAWDPYGPWRHGPWDRHDERGEHRPGRNGGDGVHVPDGKPQWQCFAAPCEPPSGART